MTKTYTEIPLGRKCRTCKSEIVAVIYKDEDGYFIGEKCDCEKSGHPARIKFCDIPEYRNEVRTRIAAELKLLKELDKYVA